MKESARPFTRFGDPSDSMLSQAVTMFRSLLRSAPVVRSWIVGAWLSGAVGAIFQLACTGSIGETHGQGGTGRSNPQGGSGGSSATTGGSGGTTGMPGPLDPG